MSLAVITALHAGPSLATPFVVVGDLDLDKNLSLALV